MKMRIERSDILSIRIFIEILFFNVVLWYDSCRKILIDNLGEWRMEELNKNIKIVESERKIHSKALEEYVHCEFDYSVKSWDGWVPVEYRRTGVSIKPEDTIHLISYLNTVYEQMNPENFSDWKKKQDEFWKEKSKAEKTKEFFLNNSEDNNSEGLGGTGPEIIIYIPSILVSHNTSSNSARPDK